VAIQANTKKHKKHTQNCINFVHFKKLIFLSLQMRTQHKLRLSSGGNELKNAMQRFGGFCSRTQTHSMKGLFAR
jgi:hypothetical protein